MLFLHGFALTTSLLLATTLSPTAGFSSNASYQLYPRHRKLMSNNNDNQDLVTTADITECIRQESIEQFSDVMDHFMFELGNDIVFLQNSEDTSKYINANFDAILFDCDGVLYRGTDAIPNAAASLKSLLKYNKKLLFVTNNAGSSQAGLREKLATILDCPELKDEQMVTSSYSAARYVQKIFEKRGLSMDKLNIHIVGAEGLCDEFRRFGANVTGGPSQDKASMSREELAVYSFEEEEGPAKEVDAVIVGLDNEFNYRKLCVANVLLQRNPDALLIATNEDAYDLVGQDSRHLPGNGSLVKAIECCSQREATNVGKPSNILADILSDEHGLDPSRTLFVGDRLDTDIKFARNGGMKSALVLTGCTTADKLMEIGDGTDDEPLPHIIFPHMGMMGLQ